MTKSVQHLFADLTARIEDMHGIAVEGQKADNAPDMDRVLASQLRMGIAAMDSIVGEIRHRLGDAHD